jgi:hypothetical protein
VSSASAHRWHGGPFFPLFAVGAAVATGIAAVVSAPFIAVGAALPGPGYYGPPPPAYYRPGPGYYAPGYYAPGYYGPPQGYYAPGPYYGR